MDEGEGEASAVTRRRQQRYGLLLISILCAFALQGIAEPGPIEQIIVSALLGTTLLLALWTADSKPHVVQAGAAVTTVLVALSIVEAVAGEVDAAAPRIADLLLVLLAPAAVIIGVNRSLRARGGGGVSLEAVFGVLCLYILLGMGFAFVYGAIGDISGSFFAGGVAATGTRCLYFSFATLTTVGYGDLTAASNLGHTLAVAEALLGQIYLVTVVSLIVSNLRPRSRRAS